MKNPFRPTFGASPRVWAGREAVLDEFGRALDNGPGDPHRSIIVSGSRGIGKTVLLTELEDIARRRGWVVLRASGREGMAEALTNSVIPEALQTVNPRPGRTITGFSVAGIGSVRTEEKDISLQPRLITRLRELLDSIDTGVLITIDEVQDSDPDDLSRIAVAYQDLVRDDAEIALAMAGLTRGVNRLLDLPGATFLRRARHYELGPLTLDDAIRTLTLTAAESDKPFAPDAAEQAARFTQGYPYLVQLIGYLAWDEARGVIGSGEVAGVRREAIERLGTQVHQPSLRDVPLRQREYLEAMALLGGQDVTSSDLAEQLGRPVTGLSDTRAKLIERDLIMPTGWGAVSFAQPYLEEYIRTHQRPRRIS
ncbi:ATP-binding protein [Corynebacterium mayonis]|uniref:ATP-binding protein n=1 Tax=Corynebacterium mayonis TaxID=3062461 RepID=UPI0031408D4E